MSSSFLVNLNCCRICGETFDEMINLFATQNNGDSAAEAITRYTQLTVQQSDDRPTHICLECSRKLNDVHEFWTLANSSEEKFRQMILVQQTTFPAAIESVYLKENVEEANLLDNECGIEFNADYEMDMVCDIESENIVDEIEELKVFENPILEYCDEANISEKLDDNETEILLPCFVVIKRLTPDAVEQKNRLSNELQTDSQTNENAETKSKRKYAKRSSVNCSFQCQKSKEHKNEKSNLCTICGKTFQFKSQLEAHCVTHSDVKPFACAHCPSKFNRKDSLKDHLDVHSDAKFACDLCDVVLATKKTLKCHKITVHYKTGKKTCEICSKKVSKRNFTKHLLTHTGEKPYKCEYSDCQQRFQQSGDLLRHLARLHVGDNLYQCDVDECKKGFRLFSELRKHSYEHYKQQKSN